MHTTDRFGKGDPRAVRRACMRVRDRVGLMICQQRCRNYIKEKETETRQRQEDFVRYGLGRSVSI
jgi:hypothetical protein